MLSRHMGGVDEGDFPLYPDPAQSMFPQQPFFNIQNFDIDNTPYNFQRAQAPYAGAIGFGPNSLYVDTAPSATSYTLESPELRTGAPSIYSTASGPSATSSAMGSPHSIQGHVASMPEWAPPTLALNPGIVKFDSLAHNGNEYNFPSAGMEEFASDFDPTKPVGFVGECENISRFSCSRQHSSPSSNPQSLSLSISASSPGTVNEWPGCFPSPGVSPMTPLSGVSRGSGGACFSPDVSPLPQSPISLRRPSETFKNLHFASSSTASRAENMQSSPISTTSLASVTSSSPSSPFAPYLKSPFFSQSSGSFVLPLELSCWFPLVNPAPSFWQIRGPHANFQCFRPVYPPPAILRASLVGNTAK